MTERFSLLFGKERPPYIPKPKKDTPIGESETDAIYSLNPHTGLWGPHEYIDNPELDTMPHYRFSRAFDEENRARVVFNIEPISPAHDARYELYIDELLSTKGFPIPNGVTVVVDFNSHPNFKEGPDSQASNRQKDIWRDKIAEYLRSRGFSHIDSANYGDTLFIDAYRTRPTAEVIPQRLPPHVFDLFELTGDDMEILRKRIAQSNGIVRVYVHPYFVSYHNPRNNGNTAIEKEHKFQRGNPRIDLIKDSMRRILGKEPSKTPPVFVFEEQDRGLQTGGRLGRLNNNSGNDVYIVPSQPGSPEPKFRESPVDETIIADMARNQPNTFMDSPEVRKLLDERWRKNWERLRELFRSLGVKKIIAGGAFLNVQDNKDVNKSDAYFAQRLSKNAANSSGDINLDYFLQYCLGSTIRNLSQDFDIEVSNFAYPDNRQDIQKKEREIK